MRVLAVDFGTSNTVAALGIDGGAPRLVTIDGSPLVPSSVYLNDDGTLAVGRDADRQARIDPSRYEPNPKRRIDDGVLLLGDRTVPVATAIGEVLRRVRGEVIRQLDSDPDQIRLTHPARWGQRRKDTLVAAARHAGLPGAPILIPEPVAAATHFATLSGRELSDGQALAVYDLGGGTFDIAVVRRRGGGYEVLAEAGLPDLGGLDFDHAILEHIGTTHARDRDTDAWDRLLRPVDADSRRMARALSSDVRDGKESLSRFPHVDIALPQPFADVHLTRAEFEGMIRPNLVRSVDLMGQTIRDAHLTPDALAGVFLVGGSSRVPLVARLIQEGLGVTPTTLGQPETSVSTGALYLGVGPRVQPAAQGPVAPPTGQVPAVRPTPSSGQPVGYSVANPRNAGPIPPVTRPPGPLGPPTGANRVVPGARTGPTPVPGPLPPGGAVRPLVGAAPPGRFAPANQRPNGTGPPGPGGPRKPGNGKYYAIGGAAVAVVALVVSLIVALSGGSGDPGGDPSQSNDPQVLESVTDDKFRALLIPVADEIQSCDKDSSVPLGGGSGGSTDIPSSLNCTFDDGTEVMLGSISSSGADEAELVTGVFEGFGFTSHEDTWSGGTLNTYTLTVGSASGSSLYWSVDDDKVWGLITSVNMDADAITDWWRTRFGD